jgi:hypothetical protein
MQATNLIPHRDDHQNGQQSGYVFHYRCVDCRPGGRRGDTEQVVARWRHLAGFMKALDLIHWAMNAVLPHRTAMAIKMACNGDAFVLCHRLFHLA